MLRDPYFIAIESALQRPIDAELFERCAQSLLSEVYPTLVPIRGGCDGGMDGAIANAESEPYPLVVTTSVPSRNLRNSLRSYRASGGVQNRVVFACSNQLNGKQRLTLARVARELEFSLVQIHDRADFAQRLYHRPEWCKELLNLTGQPSALSKTAALRQTATIPLVGRETVLQRLIQCTGDSIVAGQPGSGKTFLMARIVEETDDAYFLAADIKLGSDALANEIRAKSPQLIVLDDAHVALDQLRQLRELRQQINADFRIVATSWPSAAPRVAEIVRIDRTKLIELPRLTRDEIKQIVDGFFEEHHLIPHQWLVKEIIDQAGGQPGLATTLCDLCTQGKIQDVWKGEALLFELFGRFGDIVDGGIQEILASFAIGGKAGMSLPTIASILGITAVEVRRVITELSAAGVVNESGEHLVVVPPPLRHVLAKTIFFNGPTCLDPSNLLSAITHPDQTVEVLIGARKRGGKVPDKLIVEHLDRCSRIEPWRSYAYLGEKEAAWILEERPGQSKSCLAALLDMLPRKLIPILLDNEQSARSRGDSLKSDGLYLIHEWIEAADPMGDEGLANRQILAEIGTKWKDNGGNSSIAVDAMATALRPTFEQNSLDAGCGRTFTVRHGTLKTNDLEALKSLWPTLLNSIPNSGLQDWKPVQDMILSWIAPRHVSPEKAPERHALMQSFGRQMLSALLNRFPKQYGLRHWARDLEGLFDDISQCNVPADFSTLYPRRRYQDWRAAHEKQFADVKTLASEWSALKPRDVAATVKRYQGLARSAGIRERYLQHVADEIARQSDSSPTAWATEFVDAQIDSSGTVPFLRHACISGFTAETVELLSRCIASDAYAVASCAVVLYCENSPEELVQLVMYKLPDITDEVETWVACDNVASKHLHHLLASDEPELRLAVGKGLWQRHYDPPGVPAEFVDKMLLVMKEEQQEHSLIELFESYPAFAHEWLEHQIISDRQRRLSWRTSDIAIGAATTRLSVDQRRELIDAMDDRSDPDGHILLHLIGTETALCRHLLSKKGSLSAWHLFPLGDRQGMHDLGVTAPSMSEWMQAWSEMATVAFDYGFNEDEIVTASYDAPFGRSWSGSEAEMHQRCIANWRRIDPGDKRVARVIDKITRRLEEWAEYARKSEQHEDQWRY
jgi:hypothetical protein